MAESERGITRAAALVSAAVCLLALCFCLDGRAFSAGFVEGKAGVDGTAVKAERETAGNGVLEKIRFRGKDGFLAPTALHVGRNAVWVGHRDAVSWMEKGEGEWKTAGLDEVACPGGIVHSLAEDAAGGVWLRSGSEGGACRFSPSEGSWEEFFDTHILFGDKVTVEDGRLYLTGRGGPEHEGVSVFAAGTLELIDYYHTKPVDSMLVDGNLIWIGESAGLLRIDTQKDAYEYFLPKDTGCGITTKAITSFDGRIAIATRGGYTGYMGDRMELSMDRLRVYVEESGKWFEYGKGAEERARLNEDIKSGAVPVVRVMTDGGTCIYQKSSGKWERIGAGEGLPVAEADAVASTRGRLFVSTGKGLVVLDKSGGSFVPVHQATGSLAGKIKQLETDGKSLWMLTIDSIYRADLDKLLKK